MSRHAALMKKEKKLKLFINPSHKIQGAFKTAYPPVDFNFCSNKPNTKGGTIAGKSRGHFRHEATGKNACKSVQGI